MNADQLLAVLRERPTQRYHLSGFAEAAVLVLLVVDDDARDLDAARLVFTVRHANLRVHAGQIAFPGGGREVDDADLAVTALRETEEELGIARARVEVAGMLDDVPTPSRYIITPIVGLTRGPLAMNVEAREVAEVFEVSLAELRAPASYRADGERVWENVSYVMHEYHVAGKRIWGATARIVHQLLSLTAA
jgi:8-oxo-dGTP pyrophosphatase MutT (NUDIX family)